MSICKNCFHSYVCEQFNKHRECENKNCHFAYDHFVSTTDVVEVKHGYYERVSEDTYRCSICHYSPIADINNKWAFTNYCHKCGAKMKEREKV